MKFKKTLTIAIPTYNRAPFLKQNLENITSQIKGLEDQIEVMISDNCSEDNTQEVVKEFIDRGVPLVYNRNSKNLGMDGNFVYCFKNASSKYVWLLGDDDYLVEGTLARLLEIMNSGEYGLIHLFPFLDSYPDNFEVYSNKTSFVGDIGFYITFISANIVRTKYVEKIDFTKYLGTYFTLIPVYLTAAINEKDNVMVRFKTLEAGQDAITNGGFNIFEISVTNYLNVIKEFRCKLGWKWYEIEKYRLCRKYLVGLMQSFLIDKKLGPRFETKGWLSITLKKYWYEPYIYPVFALLLYRKVKSRFKK